MPILEEIDDLEDIDNLDMNLAELDSDLKTPIAPKITPTVVRSQDKEEPPLFPTNERIQSFKFFNPETGHIEQVNPIGNKHMSEIKQFQILYPCYFDKNRSCHQGRRVPLHLAVENPLAKSVSDAVRSLGLISIFESEKTHPQDFSNPGRVRVLLKSEGKLFSTEFKNKRYLLKRISEYLKAHPTTLKSLREIPYGPDFDGIESKKIPKLSGMLMNDIVPLHSPLMMGHPMTKSIYESPQSTAPEKQPKIPKNKYKVIRR